MTTTNSAKRATPNSTPRFTLFWRLFLSLLLMLLMTSALSIGIERWLTSKQVNSRMQAQVAQLLVVREEVSDLIKTGDFDSIRQRYHQDRRFMEQVRIINEKGYVVLFRGNRPLGNQIPKQNYEPVSPSNSSKPNNRQDNADINNNRAWQQISVDEDTYPQLADTTVLAPNGEQYTIQLQPRLPLPEIMASRRHYTWLRIALIMLFSVLACYWFSRTLTHRIGILQQAVHRISEGSYKNNNDLTQLWDDELGMLAKEVGQLSERLHESENARRRMLSDISHELRSPLARLDIATELTRDFAPNAERYLDRIDKESGRMNALIDQIIQIQSLQMNSYNVDTDNIEPINILALLEDIKDDVNFEFQNKKVSWQWQSNIDKDKPDTYKVLGNQEQLYSAFENIIRNAFEHTKDNTEVVVSLDKASLDKASINPNTDALQISITDAGLGIDNPTDLERIFQPFVRLNSARSRHSDNSVNQLSNDVTSTGYGLGLAIAHAIVRAHDGQISAQNRQDGVTGLVIRVKLPISLTL